MRGEYVFLEELFQTLMLSLYLYYEALATEFYNKSFATVYWCIHYYIVNFTNDHNFQIYFHMFKEIYC